MVFDKMKAAGARAQDALQKGVDEASERVAARAAASGVEIDKQEQYDKVEPFILSSERLYAVFDCKGAGTGFVAITNKRLLFYDKAPMRRRKALTSVPFNKLTSVSAVDEGRGLWGATSELTVRAGSDEFDFEFRGGDKAQRAYKLIMTELLENEPA